MVLPSHTKGTAAILAIAASHYVDTKFSKVAANVSAAA